MVAYETLNKQINDRRALCNCQIICTTADNVMNLLSDDNIVHFIKKLKFIAFDEVHIPDVFSSYQILSKMNLNIQYVLLSATISNSDEILEHMTKNLINPTCLIKYNIRPIPIQKTLFKENINLNLRGANITKEDLSGSTLSLYENLNDPTIRDIKKLLQITKKTCVIPDNREEQFNLGSKIISDLNPIQLKELKLIQNQKIIHCSDDQSHINILTLIQSLIANGMGPIIIFNKYYSECINLAKNLLKIIQNLEMSDQNIKKAQKYMENLNKLEKKKQDKLNSNNINTEEKIRNKEMKDHQNKTEEEENKIKEKQRLFIKQHLFKWKFKSNMKKKITKNEWINELISYGIGIHCKGIRSYIRNIMFNSFNEKNIDILIADETLSVGVNLPVRSVIIFGDIDMTNYTHMCGRAGRRGIDNQGYIIPLMNKDKIQELYNSKKLIHYVTINNSINMLELLYICKYYSNNFIKKIWENISKRTDFQNIQNIVEWIYKNDIINDNIIDLPLFNNNSKLVNLCIVFKSDILYKHFKKYPSNIKDLLILLSLMIQPIEDVNSKVHIKSDIINNFIIEHNKSSPIEFNFNTKISSYIIDFYDSGNYDEKLKDNIGIFQRSLFNIINYLQLNVDNKNIILEKLNKLDNILWQRCQINNIKV